MPIVAWNPHGFHLVNLLPMGQKWTSQAYIDHILPVIGALRDARDREKLVVHDDKTKPHIAKRVKQYLDENGLRSTPRPPYSQDLAPSDFFALAM
jgi:transposase